MPASLDITRAAAGRLGVTRPVDCGIMNIMLDDSAVSAWCAVCLGAHITEVVFRSGHLAQVLGVELADGRRAVVKIRPSEPRITGCIAVQEHLAAAGFPCPEPLAGPDVINGFAVTGEALVPGGSQLLADLGAAPFAGLLAWLISLSPEVSDVPTLTPSPPWNAWDHPGTRLWPDRDDMGRDLNETSGPAWVDAAAAHVRERMSRCRAPLRAGHGDWESQNIRWAGDQPLAVHDWDSVIAQPEVAIAGLASAVWPAAGGSGDAASVGQSADFLEHYQAATGKRWEHEEVRDAWAAGLWVRLFNAKKDAATGGGAQLDRLAEEIDDRLDMAGLPRESRA